MPDSYVLSYMTSAYKEDQKLIQEKRGLVRRERDAGDRRYFTIYLTEEGDRNERRGTVEIDHFFAESVQY